ncbi:MAG: cob(I)yrinic acid a,c-diamide adenosyltransferase [Clostridia bacterium]|nr:cob(I)yrinic acid a,c-diamide adenosyltransferase [Clostridia bacterium]
MDSYRLEKGLVQVYTGNGKGKSTAAFGLALRAAGQGLRVLIVQFLKAGDYGEHRSLVKLRPEVEIRSFGRPGFIKPGRAGEEDVRLAGEGFCLAEKEVTGGEWDVVILDEINSAVQFGLIPVDKVLSLISRKPAHVELVLTGRNAPEEVVAAAHLVTEMREVKHPYQNKIPARRGIEY